MIGKIDVRQIVADHFATLVDEDRPKQQSGLDFFLFVILPILAATALLYFDLILGKSIGNVLITALAVFAGLLFNLLLLIFDIANKPRPENERLDDLKRRFLREIYSNIAYSIFIALLTIVILLIHFLFLSLNSRSGFVFSAFVIYFLCGNFILTLFMVLKRIHILLATEFKH